MGVLFACLEGVADGALIVKPEIAWHHLAFRSFWSWKSRRPRGDRRSLSTSGTASTHVVRESPGRAPRGAPTVERLGGIHRNGRLLVKVFEARTI